MDVEELRAKARASKEHGGSGSDRGLKSPMKPREFILSFGMQGVGKSKSILDAARACPQDTFWCIDSELSNYDRLLGTEYRDVKNVDVRPALEWDDWKRGIKEIGESMKVDDWIVVDSTTPTWDAVQGWFSEQIHGEEPDEWFLQKRLQNQRANDSATKASEKTRGFAALSGEQGDWQVINKQYFKNIYNRLLMAPGHKYLTAEQDTISKEDDREVRGTYGAYGIKPKGQKRLGYVPMTVLWLTKKRVGEWYMTTIKDRGRKELEELEWSDFAEDYLLGVAGWGYE